MKKQTVHCFAVLMRSLKESDMTYKEIIEVSGMSRRWAFSLIGKLHKERQVHICGFYRDALGRESIRVWRFGRGTDAKPYKASDAEKQRRYKARRKIRAIPLSLLHGGVAV